MEKTLVGMSSAFWYNNVDKSILRNIVSPKDQKLENYKILNRRYVITEWWLVVFFPTIEHTDFSKFQLKEKLNTKYDHVYLTEPGSFYMKLK